ncbi:MAG: hypothetical protein WAO98_02255 [Alphaproteobacteria bacterium]
MNGRALSDLVGRAEAEVTQVGSSEEQPVLPGHGMQQQQRIDREATEIRNRQAQQQQLQM